MARIQPWAQAASGDLAPAFDAEAARWRRDLAWDTRDLWPAIERARVSGRLDGLILRDDAGAIAGWTYFVTRGDDVHCGALHAVDAAATATLLDALLATADATRAERVLFFVYPDAPGLDTLLVQRAFDLDPHEYRVCPLGVVGRASSPGRVWDLRDLEATAAVLQAAYPLSDPRRPFAPHGRTAEWQQYVSDIVMGQGCGRFRPTLSLAVAGERGTLDAVALVTDLGDGTAHLAQIAVRPALRGTGLGAAMLDAVRRQSAAAGCTRLSLLVARDNARAQALYGKAGFTRQAEFLCAVRAGRRLEFGSDRRSASTAP